MFSLTQDVESQTPKNLSGTLKMNCQESLGTPNTLKAIVSNLLNRASALQFCFESRCEKSLSLMFYFSS